MKRPIVPLQKSEEGNLKLEQEDVVLNVDVDKLICYHWSDLKFSDG